jgi:hypothetical protein
MMNYEPPQRAPVYKRGLEAARARQVPLPTLRCDLLDQRDGALPAFLRAQAGAAASATATREIEQ